MQNNSTHRDICDIAGDIRRDWGAKVNFAAKPYLEAMLCVAKPTDKYYYDSAESLVRYFLGNASTYRGDKAKQYKAELKAIVGMK